MIKHIFERADGTFREVTWVVPPGISPVSQSGETLRYEGDSSAVPQSLIDEMIAAEPTSSSPAWGAFMDEIAPSLYATIYAHQPAIIQRMIRLEAGTAWGGADDPIFVYWNTPTGPELTLEQFDTLAAAFTAHNIPATATRDGGTGVTTIVHEI